MPVPPSLDRLFNIFSCILCLVQLQMIIFDFEEEQWLTRNNLTTELWTVVQQCGLPANNFYSHSFRIGAATAAAKAGLPPWLIKVLGC